MSLLPRRRSLRATVAGVTIVGLVLAAAGCSRQVGGQATPAGANVSASAVWGPCKFNAPAQIEMPEDTECGLLAVPVDYDVPDGDVIDLALIRFPATGEKIGSLVFNPGGPGESGIEAAFGLLPTLPPEIREHFDFVGFDPRGVAASSPALWCNSDADNDRQRAEPVIEYTREGVDYLNKQTEEYVQRCVDKMGVDFLANVGTDNVARDLDRIREAVGDEKLTFLGYSYGTRIGTTYAEMYPQNVRAMILDGAIDPNADPVESDIAQAAAFQSAFNDFAADCAKSPDCPLGTDPAKAVEVYKDLMAPWQETPAPTTDPRGLSYFDAATATIMALYSPTLWRHLSQGLAELKEGRGDTLLILADLYMRRDGNGHYTNATDVRMAVNCMDEQRVTDMATLVDEDRRLREAAPFLATGEFTGLVPEPTCNKWPVPPTSEPHELSVPDLPATLVVSITGDPATPYEAGVQLANQLGGGLVTFNGTQHTVVFRGNACVDDYAVKYLMDGAVPGPDTEC
ncbi:alpha/beta hydrolase [Mycobacterium sp. MS1601]|uniref:alpha/beta hydrolase n=1 Tax=Mycobacterium sp. MS1601 TaxID=1936029 RepID=UPI0009795E05|nr:alpha/beta hydrolase [Mycobacterium sp. MS1601]AQA04802.1 alpha/beta hydrolase [Mycobacterium sp. MS1601]